MNVPYYNPYPQFYGQPMPDQLAQLRQGVFQPPQQQMPTQQTTHLVRLYGYLARVKRMAIWLHPEVKSF